jgi:hypothetical protein
MKRFDDEAIFQRMLDRLRIKLDWSIIADKSEVNILLKEIASGLAEQARYNEYLFNEKKWHSAQNLTSLTHMGNLIGRKAARPKSAIGFVVVTATDPEGVDRLQNLGKYFFTLDTPSNYDNIIKDTTLPLLYQKALTPWIWKDNYTIPKDTRIVSTNGVEFLVTKTCISKTLTEPWKNISLSLSKTQNFYKLGGWDNIKYVKVPIIQGKIKKINFGIASGAKFETFKIQDPNVENASNAISQEYFKVKLTLENGDVEEWLKVPNILLCEAQDKVYEVYTSQDGDSTMIRFGDGLTGSLIPKQSLVEVQYLQSMGASGNITDKYQLTKIIFPEGTPMMDPRTKVISNFLTTTNITPVTGGRNKETEQDYREEAPLSYLDYYTLGTPKQYENYIRKNSPITLKHLKLIPGAFNKIETVEDGLILVKDIKHNYQSGATCLQICATGGDCKVIENAQEQLIEPVALGMKNIKAPTENFKYLEPNFVDLKANIIVHTISRDVSDADVFDSIKVGLSSEWGIENTTFDKPVRVSDLIKIAKIFPFSEQIDLFIEAKAQVDYKTDNLVLYTTRNNNIEVLGIPFRFPKVFGINSYKRGFYNYRNSADYLIRADIEFINKPSAVKRSRSLFLIDQRGKSIESLNATLQTSKSFYAGTAPIEKDSIIGSAFGELIFFKEEKDGFQDRCVRTAQFNLIKQIITSEYWNNTLLNFDNTPSELRPYVVNGVGQNRLYNVETESVESSLAVIPEGGSGFTVYKKNLDYVDYMDIVFEENYEYPDSDIYAHGLVLMPLSHCGWQKELEGITSAKDRMELISQLLQSFLKLEVSARPLLEDIVPYEENDLISFQKDDILIERKIIESA